MKSIFQQQADFMEACGQTTKSHNGDQIMLYRDLISEEFNEFKESITEEERADAIIDMIVVIVGYGLSRGWPMDKLWDEVHRTNMAKIDPLTGKVRRREDGKILKPAGWTPPNLSRILAGR